MRLSCFSISVKCR